MRWNRRELLRLTGTSILASARTEALDEWIARRGGHPDDETFWLGVRELFTIDPERPYWNHAGLGPSPRAAIDALERETRRANRAPSRIVWREQDRELDVVRERVAKLLGCTFEELALTPNATYGLHSAILGVPMQADDEILVTAHEYSRTFDAVRQRERREGTKTVTVPLDVPPEDPEAITAKTIERFSARTRLLVLSQMTYLTGQVLPTHAIANHAVRQGVPVLVDGAHGTGLLDADVDTLGATLYTTCFHKWTMGPVGTGAFVVRSPWIDKVWPLHPAQEDWDRRMGKFEQWGTRSAAPFLALIPALDLHERLGADRKAARLETLRRRLVEPLLAREGITLLGSLDPDRCRVIATLHFAKAPARDLASHLWKEHGIHVTTVDRAGLEGIRVSPNVFTTCAEVDRLVTILQSVAQRGL
ncbi:MAG: aminotransferase class V-fold PLP-dependent enzyme [Planctomycetes bacterium]|nr:aminotransferase class V-fold PLP-dependent enzyme [Planctomycetota bacterium]